MILGLAQLFPVSRWPSRPDWELLEGRACATPDSESPRSLVLGGGRMKSARGPARRWCGDCWAPVQLQKPGFLLAAPRDSQEPRTLLYTQCHQLPCCHQALPSVLGLPLSPRSVTGAGATLVLGEDRVQAAAGPLRDITVPEEARKPTGELPPLWCSPQRPRHAMGNRPGAGQRDHTRRGGR